ncbi:hypothetical protein ACQ4PT_041937 [Festuca glaucescens]
MAVEPPPKNHPGDPSTPGGLGYFYLRIVGPATPLLLLRSDRLYSLSFSRRRGHRLRLLASSARREPRRRCRDLLISTSDCALRLSHCFSRAGTLRVNGLPLHGGSGGPVDLAVGDEVSLLLLGVRYGFVAEKFVSCERGEKAAGSCEEVIVLRAESLRKRLRAISESQDPLSFLRGSHCAHVGVKKVREEGGFLCQDSPINPVPEENLRQEESNLDQGRLEHQNDFAKESTVSKKEDTVELPQRSQAYTNDNMEHKGCSNGNVEQHHTEGRYSDGSTFFLNCLSGIRPEMRTEQESGVTLPELLHPIGSLLRANRILHIKSARRMFLGSVQTSVVGLSHRFHMPSDAGSQLKSLSVFLGKCHENMHGTAEVILKRNTNIPADANAVSVLVADLDKFSEEDSVQLGFLPREVAKWVSPLSDMGFFEFSGFIYPREALEAAFGVTNTKVQLLLYVSKGPEFSRMSGLIRDEHLPSLCSLVASLKKSLGLWRLEEVLSRFKWPETLETDFMYSASSIGTSINSQFIAHFASATGKRANHDFDSEESDPEVVQRRFRSRKGGHSFGWTYCGSHNFSPAAWGQPLRPPSKANITDATRAAPSGPRLHICNYELGIILIAPPPGLPKKGNGRVHGIDGISLPFVIPAPRYKHSDRPATPLAMREAMAEACIPQSNDFSEETDEDIADEDDELVVELSDCSPEEKEEEKIYAETLWGQVDSSQSQGKDT